MKLLLILLMLSLPVSRFGTFIFSSCDGWCMETDAWGTCNPSGDQCALVGKIPCVILFSLGMMSIEGFAGLRAVCID